MKTPDIVIGADTIVVRGRKHCSILCIVNICRFFIYSGDCFSFSKTVDGMILEKPVDKHDAYRMLSRSVSFTLFLSKQNKRKLDLVHSFSVPYFFLFQSEW